MYEVKSWNNQFEFYELRESQSGSWFRVCPWRGGIVTSFAPGGREMLYLDEETLFDESTNVRGGIPVLWPICGQLPNGEYEWDHTMYKMANHGLARRFPWTVVGVETEGSASITLAFESSERTRREFPFDFRLEFRYELQDAKLTIHQTYSNLSNRPLPMHAGLHPYFLSKDKDLSYASDATRLFDYNTLTETEFSGNVELSGKVESLALLDSKRPEVSFEVSDDAGKRRIGIQYGKEFRYVVLWSVDGKPFVCVEPWMAKNASLISREGLVMVPGGESITTYVTFFDLDSGANEQGRG